MQEQKDKLQVQMDDLICQLEKNLHVSMCPNDKMGKIAICYRQ